MSLCLFLRLVGPLLLMASTALFGTIQTPPADPPARPADLRNLSEKYGLQILTQPSEFPAAFNHGPIEGREATPEEVAWYGPILASEWNLYPVDLIKRTRLKRLVLCKDLSYAKQKRTAIPDFDADTLYLDVVRGRKNDLYVREVIHHEYYHIIDLRDDGKLYQDDEWVKLNPPGFKYLLPRNGPAVLGDHPTGKAREKRKGKRRRGKGKRRQKTEDRRQKGRGKRRKSATDHGPCISPIEARLKTLKGRHIPWQYAAFTSGSRRSPTTVL
jgi:hypothetical protein